MSRPLKVLLTVGATLAIGAVMSACGTQKIALSPHNPLYGGAVLFNQRCSGCHTLAYAAARGSAQFVRTKELNNGPNFNVRCERPVSRVLYAIENGGFSGQIMPQNIVVGDDAKLVARFVATYAGRQAPKVPGAILCDKLPVGAIPSPSASTSPASTSTSATSTQHATSPGGTATVPAAGQTGAAPNSKGGTSKGKAGAKQGKAGSKKKSRGKTRRRP